MDYTSEVQTKLARVRALMDAQGVDTLWLRTVSSVAWITGGVDTAVNHADTMGVASVVITPDAATVVTNSIEGPRLAGEDGAEARGFALRVTPWERPQPADLGGRLGVDAPLDGARVLSRELKALRSRLLPVEVERFRALGSACAAAMNAAIQRVRPGMSEWQLAAALAREAYARDATPIVVLIASDERIHRYRHPLPTSKIMDCYAMLVLCARQAGLVCSITRLVHFGALPPEISARMNACAEVDAAIIAASQPGAALSALFKTLQDAYARAGFADEWKLHHQGGTAGYEAREFIATPGETEALEPGMICAWNPSITGVKSEDTILVPKAGEPPEILTAIADWPARAIAASDQIIERPLILEVL
jgi:antitoxin VapB